MHEKVFRYERKRDGDDIWEVCSTYTFEGRELAALNSLNTGYEVRYLNRSTINEEAYGEGN